MTERDTTQDPKDAEVDDATRRFEEEDAETSHGADRPPTPEEEKAAAGLSIDESVRDHYKDMSERGANEEGEGRID